MGQLKERLIHCFQALVNGPIFKIIGIETSVLSKFWLGIRTEIFLVLFLVLMDLISGIMVSIKYKKISSWGLRQTVLKLSVYLALIFMGGVIKIATGFDWMDSALVGLIAATEMISIIENIQLTFPNVLPKSILQHFGISVKRKRSRR